MLSALVLACASLAACGGESDGTTTGGGATTTTGDPPADCGPADLELGDGRCQPPGLPLDMQCPPGETPLGDGGCQAAGVPPELCGDGFVADGGGGCKPILPEGPCPFGLMAIPGEAECREVAPCGTGTWGDIPVEPDTEFVDGSYAGGDSDGSPQKPWKAIQKGLDAAAKGAIVAIAAGTYEEELDILFKVNRLWGRCPAMVTIAGVSPSSAAVATIVSGLELHDLAITGPHLGVYIDGGGDMLLENVWIHDTGIAALNVNDSASAVVRGSLIERASSISLFVKGASLLVERSVVRDALPLSSGPKAGSFGRAVEALSDGASRSDLTLRSSLFERAGDLTLHVDGSDATIEGVAVRDAMPVSDVAASYGIGLAVYGSSGVTVRGSTFERLYTFGIVINHSEATIEGVTVIDGRARPSYDTLTVGIFIDDDKDGAPSKATIRRSAVAAQPGGAIGVLGSSATIESTLVRDNNQKKGPQSAQAAVTLEDAFATVMRYMVIRDDGFAGLSAIGGEASLEASVVSGLGGNGAGYCAVAKPAVTGDELPGVFTIQSSLVEHCAETGVAVSRSRLVMETSIVRDVVPGADGRFGDGVVILGEGFQPTTAKLTGLRIEAASRAGVAAFGAQVDIGFSSISCAKLDLAGEKNAGFTFMFNKLGDNACGCPEATELCRVVSPGLEPPDLPSLEPPP